MQSFKTSDFDYHLPQEQIAQFPANPRDSSRLLVLQRNGGLYSDMQFSGIAELLRRGDRLIFNDTRVIPARVHCFTADTGIKVELLFIRPSATHFGVWEAMAKPAKRLRKGTILICEDEQLEVLGRIDDGSCLIKMKDESNGGIDSFLDRYGHIPLPPYITRGDETADAETYQTVFAANKGAIAAPTAGLHFTPELMTGLSTLGVDTTFLTLHVGAGTFRPVKDENPEAHEMHEEEYFLSEQSVNDIIETKKQGGRIVAVGTTVVRTLEHSALPNGVLKAGHGRTKLFVMPGFRFSVVDAMITNFHLPRSTLLMLVSAFADREKIMKAYDHAVKAGYRFYSYGDAMFIC